MRTVMRATCTTALALVCLHAHAKAGERCVTAVEARPEHGEATAPAPRPSLTPAGSVPQRASPADAPASAALHV